MKRLALQMTMRAPDRVDPNARLDSRHDSVGAPPRADEFYRPLGAVGISRAHGHIRRGVETIDVVVRPEGDAA